MSKTLFRTHEALLSTYWTLWLRSRAVWREYRFLAWFVRATWIRLLTMPHILQHAAAQRNPLQHHCNTRATPLQHRFRVLFAKDPRIWLTPHLLQHAAPQCNPTVTPLQHHRNTTCKTDFACSSQGPRGFDWLTSCWQNCFYWWSRTSADYQIGCPHRGCGQSHVSCSWGNFHICIHVYMYLCIYSYMYMYACIYVYIHICTCIYTNIYTYVYVCMYICIYT